MTKKKPAKTEPRTPARLVEVRESGIHGKGVYATKAISKGTRIIEYVGKRISWKEAQRKNPGNNADERHTVLFGLSNGKDVINAAVGGNESRWINHSCMPNCEAIEEDDRILIYARRNLRRGEELFYDYALELDEPRTRKIEREFACQCGSKKCRGNMLEPV